MNHQGQSLRQSLLNSSSEKGSNPHRQPPKRWGAQEVEYLHEMRKEGRDVPYIAGALRRTERQVRDKITWEGMSEDKRAKRRARINAWRNSHGEYKSVIHTDRSSVSKATPEMLAERDRRLYSPRSLSAALMGDPAPGFSALDKRGPT